MRGEPNPVGNERLTAAVGIALLLLTLAEIATILLGVHRLMSLHVFVGLVLIPPVLLKLASTGWRFARYYSGNAAYVVRGPPRLAMRVLAPLLVIATAVLLASGVAMGLVHGHALTVARRVHGPVSVIWLVLVGLHTLNYLKRALMDSSDELGPSARPSVRGARTRVSLLATAVAAGILVAIVTVPARHRWVDLPRDRHHHHHAAAASKI
jgi:hypothetical protein